MLSATIDRLQTVAANPELLEVIVEEGDGSGRGPTINKGIARATGDIILMLHSDCLLEPSFDKLLRSAFANEKIILTAFEFNANSAEYLFLVPLEQKVNMRSKRFWLPYGDQALAMRKKDLDQYFGGSIPNYKMMEDFEFVLRVRDFACDHAKVIEILPQKVVSSPRRFLSKGPSKASMLNWFFINAYVWGKVSPDRIYNWYYN